MKKELDKATTRFIVFTKVIKQDGKVLLEPIFNCENSDDCLAEVVLDLLVGDTFETELLPVEPGQELHNFRSEGKL